MSHTRIAAIQVLHGQAYEKDERQAGFVRRLRAAEPGLFADVEVSFVSLYRGWCGGLIPAEDFAKMKQEVSAALKALLGRRSKIDGICLDLHGAMGASGSEDPEAELAEAVRDAVPVGLLAASFDLHGHQVQIQFQESHFFEPCFFTTRTNTPSLSVPRIIAPEPTQRRSSGNFSERLGGALDIVAAYKTFPHDDMEETKTKALRMLLHCPSRSSSRTALLLLICS